EDPKGKERYEDKGTSYIMNEYLCEPGEHQALSISHLRSTSNTIMVFTVSDRRGTATTEEHTHSRNWFKHPDHLTVNRIVADIQPDRFNGAALDAPPEKHMRGYANYLFADGHVEIIPGDQIGIWAKEGTNF